MSHRELLSAMQGILEQGLTLLKTIDDHAYTTKVSVASDASVGAHYRHCLDHFSSLLGGIPLGTIDYDNRKRDPQLESDRRSAAEMTRSLQIMAGKLADSFLDDPIRIRCKISYTSDEVPLLHSRIDREIMFCISHAIHHYALIGMMCRLLEVALPDDFGVAPSTVSHQREMTQVAA